MESEDERKMSEAFSEGEKKEKQVWIMCLGADSHLKADRGYYLCSNDDRECLQS